MVEEPLPLGVPEEIFAYSEMVYNKFVENPAEFCLMHLKKAGECSCEWEEIEEVEKMYAELPVQVRQLWD